MFEYQWFVFLFTYDLRDRAREVGGGWRSLLGEGITRFSEERDGGVDCRKMNAN